MTIVEALRQRSKPLKVAEAAEIAGVHRVTMFKMTEDGRVPSFRMGTAVRIDPAELADYIERHSTKPN